MTSGERKRFTKAAWLLLAYLVLLLVVSALVRDSLDIEWNADSVRELVAEAGIWGPLILVGMMTFRFAFMIPSPILLTAAGICFGFALGTLYGGLGLLLSALFKLLVAQAAGRQMLLEQLPPRVRQRLAMADSGVGVGVIAVATSYPVGPAGLLHIAAILSGMSVLPFALAVGAGSLVRAGTFSLFGDALVEGEGLLTATAVLAAVMGIPLLVPRWRTVFLSRLRGR
jgi:uncharacterized membrane protein YdjX (TVP38/TMEM64 family)